MMLAAAFILAGLALLTFAAALASIHFDSKKAAQKKVSDAYYNALMETAEKMNARRSAELDRKFPWRG